MAQKRMFDKAILDTEKFMDLSLSQKASYFLLGMEADDEGFVSPKKIQRIHLIAEDDIKVLVLKNLIIPFKSGVVVITDWHRHNWLDSRRIKKTEYLDEKKMLLKNKDNSYCLANAEHPPNQCSIVQSSIVQNSTDISEVNLTPTEKHKRSKFIPPTIEEVKSYFLEKKTSIDPELFFYHYEARGWLLSNRIPMKNWKSCLTTWEKNNFNKSTQNNNSFNKNEKIQKI